jgi:hypothetical protein
MQKSSKILTGAISLSVFLFISNSAFGQAISGANGASTTPGLSSSAGIPSKDPFALDEDILVSSAGGFIIQSLNVLEPCSAVAQPGCVPPGPTIQVPTTLYGGSSGSGNSSGGGPIPGPFFEEF